jgi:hypothetical protein
VIFYVLVPRLHQGSLLLECIELGQISGKLFFIIVPCAIQHIGVRARPSRVCGLPAQEPFAFLVKPL